MLITTDRSRRRIPTGQSIQMCGIAAVVLKDGEVGPIIYDSLKRLEYRGYDSVGEAVIVDGKIVVKKDKGKIEEVERKLRISNMTGRVGIGHTRWATHGAPSQENAHPHTDCADTVAVVHNGIIENFMQLKQELEAKGHHFKSRTDTEVVAHLVEEYVRNGKGFVEAVRLASKKLTGAYALAMICALEPDKVVCVRKESPLVVGTSQNGNYCASDIPAFLSRTNQAILLEDDEMAVLTADKVRLIQIDSGEEVARDPFTVDWSVETALKTGFPALHVEGNPRATVERSQCPANSTHILGSDGLRHQQGKKCLHGGLWDFASRMSSCDLRFLQPRKSRSHTGSGFRVHRQLRRLTRSGHGRSGCEPIG